MNEELLNSIYSDLGLADNGVSFEDFSSEILSSQDLRKRVYGDLGLKDQVEFSDFEAELGIKKKDQEFMESLSVPESTDGTQSTGTGESQSDSIFEPFLVKSDRPQQQNIPLTDQQMEDTKTVSPFERDSKAITDHVMDKYARQLESQAGEVKSEIQQEYDSTYQKINEDYSLGKITKQEADSRIKAINDTFSEKLDSKMKDLQDEVTGIAQKEAVENIKALIKLNKEKGPDKLESMVSDFVRPLYKTPGQALQLLGAVTSLGDVERRDVLGLYEVGESWVRAVEELAPVNEKFAEDYSQMFANGMGQVASMLITAGTTGSISKTAALASPKTVMREATEGFIKTLTSPMATVGGIQMAVPEFEEAMAAGATPEQRMQVLAQNYIGGSVLEQAPMLQFLKRLDNVTAGGFGDFLVKKGAKAFQGGFEEGATEFLQGVYANATAKDVYDSSREIMDGVWKEGSLGFGIGATLNMMGANVRLIRQKGDKYLADKLEAELKQEAEKRLGEEFEISTLPQYIRGDKEISRVQAERLIENGQFEGLTIKNDPELEQRFQTSVKEAGKTDNLQQEIDDKEGTTRTSGGDIRGEGTGDAETEEGVSEGDMEQADDATRPEQEIDETQRPTEGATVEGATVDEQAEPQLSEADQEVRSKTDEVTFNARQNLISAVKEGKSSVETFRDNIKYLKDLFVTELKEAGVSSTELGKVSQLVNTIAERKNISAKQLSKLKDLTRTVIQKDRIKKVSDYQKSIKKNLPKGKLGERAKSLQRVINLDPLKAASKPYFEDYVNALETISKKMERGTVYGDEVQILNAIQNQIAENRNPEEVIETASQAGQFESADELINYLESQPADSEFYMGWTPSETADEDQRAATLENANTQKQIIRDNFDKIQSEPEVSFKDIGIDPQIAREVYKVGKEEIDNFTSEEGEVDLTGLESAIRERVPELGEVNMEALQRKINSEIQRDELIAEVKSKDIDEVFKDFIGTDREKEYLAEILQTDNFDNFTNSDLRNLNRLIEGSSIYVSPDLKKFQAKAHAQQGAKAIEDLAQADFVKDAYDNVIPQYERDIRNALKETQESLPTKVKENILKKLTKSRSLSNLAVLGKQINGEVDKLIAKYYGFTEAYRNRATETSKRLNSSWSKIKQNTKFEGRNYTRGDLNIIASMYMLDNHFKKDGGSGKVPPLEVVMKAYKGKGGEGQKYIASLFDRLSKEGQLDRLKTEKLFKAGNALQIVEEAEGILKDTQDMVIHNAKYSSKEPVDIFSSYFPLMYDKQLSAKAPDLMQVITQPRLKSQTSRSRKDYRNEDGTFDPKDLENLSLDLLAVVRKAANDQLRGNYLNEGFRDANAIWSYAESVGDARTRELMSAIKSGLNERVTSQVSQDYIEPGFGEQLIRMVDSNVKRYLIAKPVRRMGELFSNILLYSTDPSLMKNFITRGELDKKLDMKTTLKIMRDFGSGQEGRFLQSGQGEFQGESRDEFMNFFAKKTKDPQLKELTGSMYSMMDKLFRGYDQTIGGISDKIITFPDLLVSNVPYRNKFLQEFKNQTGEDFKASEYGGDYKSKNAPAIRKAIAAADELITRKQAGVRFASSPVQQQKNMLSMILSFFTSFRSTLADNNANALNSLFNLQRWSTSKSERDFYKEGSGSMSKGRAVATLTANMANIMAYQFIAGVIFQGALEMAMGVEAEDDESIPNEDKKVKNALKYGLTESSLMLSPVGSKNAFTYGLSQLAIEKGIESIEKGEVANLQEYYYTPTWVRKFGGSMGIMGSSAVKGYASAKNVYEGDVSEKDYLTLAQLTAILLGIPATGGLNVKLYAGDDKKGSSKPKKPPRPPKPPKR